MDTMITMMEKYTDHLEDIVAERTAELAAEKAKTDELLYRMLPKYECVFWSGKEDRGLWEKSNNETTFCSIWLTPLWVVSQVQVSLVKISYNSLELINNNLLIDQLQYLFVACVLIKCYFRVQIL